VTKIPSTDGWIRPAIIPWLLGAGVFLLVAFTSSHYGVSWDEPAYFHASDLHIQWLADFRKNLLNGNLEDSLRDDAIKAAWHWNPYNVPHPPFSRVISGLTKTFFSPFIDKFTAYRIAPALFFALLVTLMYLWIAELFDRKTALFSAFAMVIIPNLFGFAHLAVTDMPLASMWFLTVYCFWRGLKDWRWSIVLGVVWGVALSTKFPALLIPIPLLLWAHLYHRRAYTDNVFAMSFISPVVMIAVQPYLWHQTFLRILEFLYEGVSRAYRPETNYSVFFFGQLYFTKELPWYYPFFITGVTTPETILLLALAGVVALAWARPQREVMVLFLFNAGFLLIEGLLPGAVLHDGMRQLLSLLPFLVGISACGFFVLVRYLAERSERTMALQRVKHLREKVAGAAFLIVLALPTLDLFVYHPFELSYYNRLVGGIRGAYRLGLEATYFMEAFTPDFLRLLNDRLPPHAVINASFSNFMLAFYQKENRLRHDIVITDGKDFDYFVLLNRRTTFSEKDLPFLASRPHLYDALRLDGVPLILIYKARK